MDWEGAVTRGDFYIAFMWMQIFIWGLAQGIESSIKASK